MQSECHICFEGEKQEGIWNAQTQISYTTQIIITFSSIENLYRPSLTHCAEVGWIISQDLFQWYNKALALSSRLVFFSRIQGSWKNRFLCSLNHFQVGPFSCHFQASVGSFPTAGNANDSRYIHLRGFLACFPDFLPRRVSQVSYTKLQFHFMRRPESCWHWKCE